MFTRLQVTDAVGGLNQFASSNPLITYQYNLYHNQVFYFFLDYLTKTKFLSYK